MSVRTVHLQLGAAPPGASVNVWPVKVRRSIFLGDLTQVHVDWGRRELVIRQTAADAFAEGATAYLSIDPDHCVLLEPGDATETESAPEPQRTSIVAELPIE
jgi:iron(III) transport system ATP-binding protein